MIFGDEPEGVLIWKHEEVLGSIKFVLEVYRGPCRIIRNKKYCSVRIYTVFHWPGGILSRVKYDHA